MTPASHKLLVKAEGESGAIYPIGTPVFIFAFSHNATVLWVGVPKPGDDPLDTFTVHKTEVEEL